MSAAATPGPAAMSAWDVSSPTVTPQMQRSMALDALAGALSKAQAKIRTAAKDANNPHFGSRYADLASVWDACREALTGEGLAIVQLPCGNGDHVGVTTTLLHSSGQWMSSTIYVSPERKGPQSVGSVITYMRRYALAAFVGVAPDDDDGEGAMDRGGREPAPPAANDNGRRIAAQKLARRNAEPPPALGVNPPSSPDAKMATLAQLRKYHVLREAMGVSEDEGRERVSKLLGRAVASIAELTTAEMGRVIDKMEAGHNAAS